MSNNVAIGIDLGTSNSCVAFVKDGRPVVCPNAYGEHTTASVVSFAEDGTITVGNQAKARIILDPTHTVSSSKRLIGRYYFSEEVKKARAVYQYEIVPGDNNSVRIRIRDEVLSLPEIAALLLKEMKAIAETELGTPVTQAVITVPAYFNDNQRQATKDAGRIAGLEVLRILNEPTAAALTYGFGREFQQRVAVYDLGGGTFDVSVLEISDDVFEVLSTCGDTYLGGDDFDDRLIDRLAEHIQQAHAVNPRSDPFALEKLKAAAENAKIELSDAEHVRISVAGIVQHEANPVDLDYELTSQEFEKLCRDLVHRTFKVCDEAMQQAGLTVRDLDGVILVGGPTRLPLVRKSVQEYFQREPAVEIHPDEVVAQGAAIHAASLVCDRHRTFLLDVTPLSLRIGIVGGLSETIIERNSPVPIDHTRIFHPAEDGQESVSVRIYQGESRRAEENTLLGEFQFSGFEPGVREEVQIEVSFAISTEGIVKVSARDPRTGSQHSTRVSLSSGLSEQEMQEILQREKPCDRTVPTGPELPDPNEEELLDLPPVAGVNDGNTVAAGGPNPELFGAIQGDLGLPDPAEVDATSAQETALAPEPAAEIEGDAPPMEILHTSREMLDEIDSQKPAPADIEAKHERG